MPTRRAPEISYYEELGVEENASPAEVRDAFRALVRLLHPDQQTNPELKTIAERHMRRLNGIYSVLSDPAKRRDYDESLNEDSTPAIVFSPASNIDPKRFVSRFLWVGALLILAGSCVWMFVEGFDNGPSIPSDRSASFVRVAAPVSTHAETTVANSAEIESLRSELRATRSERDAARYEVTRLRAAMASRAAATEESGLSATSLTPPPLSPAPVLDPLPASRAPAAVHQIASDAVPISPRTTNHPLGSDPHQFAGFWFFAPAGQGANKNLYPPQFIEAMLTEHNGVIHGSYRSRYRVVDRAISPDVNFEFSGTANGTTLSTPWTGPGGAKGVVILTLTNENALKFDWRASDVGSLQGLASGTATLTRRID